ncbi:MAG: alpha-amylase family glycosyl hydrolase [Bacteroidota bacterium]|nr:alpha-amylase family glycosyl hydrolase [Bacteroidota bacterium]
MKFRFPIIIILSILSLVDSLTARGDEEFSLSNSGAIVPEWAKTAIWYQIFPERFRNGDLNNDPKLSDIRGSWPHDPVTEWNITPWNSDWYKLQPWEEKNKKGFYYNAQLRRYGGDVQGIIDKLDYLSELRITAIYLNPIFESPSLHKYDATFYHHVDNNFGPNPELDVEIWSKENPADPSTWLWTSADSLFLKLIRECHNRNMKIIIDGVFNHVGMTFWAFEDVKKNKEKSAYYDWFTIKQWDNPVTTKDEFEYKGWYGVKELPELKEGPNGFDNDPYKNFFFRIAQPIVENIQIGGLGYLGKESITDSIGTNNITMLGADATLDFEPFELCGQFVYRKDTNPLFINQDVSAFSRGGFVQFMYAPEGDKSKWYLFLIYNKIKSDYFNYHSLAGNYSYLVARNLKFMCEYGYDIELKKNSFTIGFVTAF